MSQSTPRGGAAGPRPPFDPVTPATSRSVGTPMSDFSDAQPPARRRPPHWLIAVAAVLVAALGVVAVLLLSNRGGGIVPEAEVITLPERTPTLEAVAREPGTAFAESLPSTVLQFALTELVPEPSLLAAGALEGYRLGYTDGAAVTLVVVAGQWPTPQDATDAAAVLVAAQVEAAGEMTETTESVEEGEVEVDGAVVGRWTLVPRTDGTATITWTNGTAVLQVGGPAGELPDVHTAYAL